MTWRIFGEMKKWAGGERRMQKGRIEGEERRMGWEEGEERRMGWEEEEERRIGGKENEA